MDDREETTESKKNKVPIDIKNPTKKKEKL